MADLRDALTRRLGTLPVLTHDNGYPVEALPKSELLDILHAHPQTDGGVPAPGGNRAPATEATATATPPSPTLNVDEVAALLLPYISHVHDGWARQEAIKAAREVVALARPENEVKAEAWDEGKAHVLELVGYPDEGWINPYRKGGA